MKVKDVVVSFDNLYGVDYHVIADLYDEDGFYIGQINKNYANGELFVSDEVRVFWKNKVKFYRMCTLHDTVMFTFMVLKGEEMKYRTVKEVIDFVGDLRAKDTVDSLLKICLEFYDSGNLVGGLVRNMESDDITLALKYTDLRLYLIDGFKIVRNDPAVTFKLSIKKPSSIQY